MPCLLARQLPALLGAAVGALRLFIPGQRQQVPRADAATQMRLHDDGRHHAGTLPGLALSELRGVGYGVELFRGQIVKIVYR